MITKCFPRPQTGAHFLSGQIKKLGSERASPQKALRDKFVTDNAVSTSCKWKVLKNRRTPLLLTVFNLQKPNIVRGGGDVNGDIDLLNLLVPHFWLLCGSAVAVAGARLWSGGPGRCCRLCSSSVLRSRLAHVTSAPLHCFSAAAYLFLFQSASRTLPCFETEKSHLRISRATGAKEIEKRVVER